MNGYQFWSTKGIYLLPNAFTTAALFAGFFALISAMNGAYINAAIAIIAAGLLDAFDGRIARLTRTESSFGIQYDNLADMVSFGVAPAILVFQWGIQDLGKPGWAIVFIYAACTALRLGRFVVQVDERDPRFFVGMPSPAAAGTIAALIWMLDANMLFNPAWNTLVAAMVLLVALLMVSTLPFVSIKKVRLRGKVPFLNLILLVFLLALILMQPDIVLFFFGCLYIASACVLFARRAARNPT